MGHGRANPNPTRFRNFPTKTPSTWPPPSLAAPPPPLLLPFSADRTSLLPPYFSPSNDFFFSHPPPVPGLISPAFGKETYLPRTRCFFRVFSAIVIRVHSLCAIVFLLNSEGWSALCQFVCADSAESRHYGGGRACLPSPPALADWRSRSACAEARERPLHHRSRRHHPTRWRGLRYRQVTMRAAHSDSLLGKMARFPPTLPICCEVLCCLCRDAWPSIRAMLICL